MTSGGIAGWIRPFFLLSGIYDLVLGGAFLLFYGPIFTALGIEPPNHSAYMHFPAAVVLAFGVGFLLIARDPERNRDLIVTGILFKLAFAGTVLWHLAFGSIPRLWVPLGLCDLGFAAAFFFALRSLGAREAPGIASIG